MNDLNCWESKFKYCCYSVKILHKIALLNQKAPSNKQVNILKIKKAIYYSKKYHGTQMRQSGEPYYSHPLAVANLVVDYCLKTDILVTSILHDTLEDTRLTKDNIASIFDYNIATNVEDLTRVKSDRKISSAEMIDALFKKEKYDLLFIKLFDRIHNLQTIKIKSFKKANLIIEETLKKFITLVMYFEIILPEMREIGESMIEVCYKYLSRLRHLQ